MITKIINLNLMAFLLVACNTDNNASTDQETMTSYSANEVKTSVYAESVVRADVQTWLFGEGTVRAVHREFLSFESPGKIIYVDQTLKEGDPVSRNQLIAYQEKNLPIDGQPGELSHTAVRDAQVNVDLARKNFIRIKELQEKRFASQQDLDEVEARLEQAQVALENAHIVAKQSRIISPLDGIIARINIKQGTYFSPSQVNISTEANALNTTPVLIIDPSSFELMIDLPSFYYSQVKAGSTTIFQPSTGSSQQGQTKPVHNAMGIVYSVSPSINPATRTFTVTLRSTSGAEYLQDGAYLSVWIEGAVAKNTLSIPIDSVRFENNKPYVFKINEDTHRVSKTFVKLGLAGKQSYELLSGLEQGDRLVTEGRSRLSDDDVVNVLNDKSGAIQ
ncbi:efflux RND transporter periplasmic adaptor subunit [Marinomonas algarum]|uniref:Efflux RND transporter periplasmic adaptor subunit n=1 Tax=Marinomonas algarum TaxID=2883105 RepID=A0A9X1ILZ5_9GAMM|nr:efflux RND transporter periplasmic adaptor subunit [Marinomonas algarum]MCB5161688.1 efflux RND transporter periplasmic adaptor subunit [Marinomonas algarum]